MQKANDSLRARLLEFMAGPGYRPLKDHELAAALALRGRAAELRAVLKDLEREGRISRMRKNRFALPARGTRDTGLRGRLRMNLQGHGYFAPETKGESASLFIHRDHLGNALDGDLVLVEPLRPRGGRGRPAASTEKETFATDGKIVRVIERKRRQLVGLLQQTQRYWYVIPDSPRITQNVRVAGFDPGLQTPVSGRKVVVRLDESPHLFEMLSGKVIEDLGEPNAPGVDVVSILRDRDLNETFPETVRLAAEARPVALSGADIAGRHDLRELPTVTIDPADAKDFDDAVSLLRNDDGTFKLYVHIADVAHFVPPHSIVDREALHRGNSVYMVDRHVPMLPKHLTADVCSLRPHSDRLAHTVIADLDEAGRVLRFETGRSVIHSKLRLNYEQVQEFMDGRSEEAVPPALRPMLRDMARLSATLRAKRLAAGALDLAMPEVKIHLDPLGRPTGIHRRGASDAYHVVEEFMLVANVCVAERLSGRGMPALYRIHELPTDEQWEKMAVDLHALGIQAQPRSQADLNRIVRRVAGTPQEYPVNLAILKNLKRAMYSEERDIHFGLAFECYTHFTSPIRRYADLVVHRALCAVEQRQKPPCSIDDCARIAQHVSETERTAAEAEQESLDVKRIEFYANELAAGRIGPYKALVAGIVNRGLILETEEALQRGLLPFAAFRDDFYEFNADKGWAQGRQRKKRITLGMEFNVVIARVDTVKRLVDFSLADDAADARAPGGDRTAAPRREKPGHAGGTSRPAQKTRGHGRGRGKPGDGNAGSTGSGTGRDSPRVHHAGPQPKHERPRRNRRRR